MAWEYSPMPTPKPGKPATKTTVFFAYAGRPELMAESMRASAEGLRHRSIPATTWQNLPIAGRLLIPQVLAAIDDSRVVIAEVGSLNSNVLFEAGYAVTSDKQFWAVMDATDTKADRNWRDFGLLANVGRVDYEGSSEVLIHKFSQARPDLSDDTVWSDLYAKIRTPRDPRALFHYATPARDDAAKEVGIQLDRRPNLSVLKADEDERGVAPLEWYVGQVYKAAAVLVHLLAPEKQRAIIHNARASFVAGLAHGLDRPLLILAPDGLDIPLDYRDLLCRYTTARGLGRSVEQWLDGLPNASAPRKLPGKVKLSVEIPLNFGDYVAEDERATLPDYFVETAEYKTVLRGGTSIFVGRKGTGKTATMLRATDELASDKRNLVVPVKPSGYELEALVQVIAQMPDQATADYFLEGLWKYLLYCEMATAAVREAQSKPAGISSGSDLANLRDLLTSHDIGIQDGFAVRLEKVVAEVLKDVRELPNDIKARRNILNQKLHVTVLRDLRIAIGKALSDRERVAILVDNLDKAWERGADYERLARMIFGLLSAIGHVSADFSGQDAWKDSVNVSLAVFLRADIFSMVLKYAREPDKIHTLQIRWTDPKLLGRVIEDRYVAAKNGEVEPEELWREFFCDSVQGVPTRDYLLWRCLSRPRDLVYLCNASVLQAVNARRSVIEEDDIRTAETEYSLFAFEALLVESDPHAGLSDLLFEFAGSPATITHTSLHDLLIDKVTDPEATISTLVKASFLGIEIAKDRFDFPMEETGERRANVLARRYSETASSSIRYRIHPAYRPYLEIVDDDLAE